MPTMTARLPKCLLLSVVLLLSIDPASAQAAISVIVDGALLWQDGGVDVLPGDRLQIQASGSILYYPALNESSGPDGGFLFFDPASFVPPADNLSLVGQIVGSSQTSLLPEGLGGYGAGYVGANYDQVMTAGGRLQLAFNDSVHADNFGSFDVSVAVIPIPEPAPVALAMLAVATVPVWHRNHKARPRRHFPAVGSISPIELPPRTRAKFETPFCTKVRGDHGNSRPQKILGVLNLASCFLTTTARRMM
jgi:hypothetical protein